MSIIIRSGGSARDHTFSNHRLWSVGVGDAAAVTGCTSAHGRRGSCFEAGVGTHRAGHAFAMVVPVLRDLRELGDEGLELFDFLLFDGERPFPANLDAEGSGTPFRSGFGSRSGVRGCAVFFHDG